MKPQEYEPMQHQEPERRQREFYQLFIKIVLGVAFFFAVILAFKGLLTWLIHILGIPNFVSIPWVQQALILIVVISGIGALIWMLRRQGVLRGSWATVLRKPEIYFTFAILAGIAWFLSARDILPDSWYNFFYALFTVLAFIVGVVFAYQQQNAGKRELSVETAVSHPSTLPGKIQPPLSQQAPSPWSPTNSDGIQGAVHVSLPINIAPPIEKKGQLTTMPSQNFPKDFFISYSTPDERWAMWIAWQLEEVGYSTVLLAWDVRPGNNFILELDTALKKTERTIMVMSSDYLTDFNTQPEWATTFARDRTGKQRLLLSIVVRDCTDQLSGLLKGIAPINLVGLTDEVATRKKLLDEIQRAVKNERAKPDPSAPQSFPGQSKGNVSL